MCGSFRPNNVTALQVKLLSNFSLFQCEPTKILKNISEDSLPGTVVKVGYQEVRKSLQFSLAGSECDLFDVENNGSVIVRDQLSSRVSDQVCFFDSFFFLKITYWLY